MRHFWPRLWHSRLGMYIRFLFLLLIVTGAIMGGMAVSGCTGCVQLYDTFDNTTGYQTPYFEFEPYVRSLDTTHVAGQEQTRELGITVASGDVDSVHFTYYPPGKIRNLAFSRPPDATVPNQSYYQWYDVDVADIISVTYTLNPESAGQTLVEELQGDLPEDPFTSRMGELWVEVTDQASLSPPGTDTIISDTPKSAAVPNSPGDGEGWYVSSAVGAEQATMTTQLCQEWVDFLQGQNAFLAVRLPMNFSSPNQSGLVPLTFSYFYSPTLTLNGVGGTPVLSIPAAMRPTRDEFLANNLPNASGEKWLGVGLAPSPGVICPAGLNIGPGEWRVIANAFLDVGWQPRVLVTYLCYEGQEQPLGGAAQQTALTIAQGLGADVGVASFQGEGITCIGPSLVYLEADDNKRDLTMWGSSNAYISPTQTISFEHVIKVSTPMSVTLDYDSSTGVPWTLFRQMGVHPDSMGSTLHITQPFWVAVDTTVWAMGIVDHSVPDGPHTLSLTVTSILTPGLAAQATDLMWVGDWISPGLGHPVYLPSITKPSPSPVVLPDLVVDDILVDSLGIQVSIRNQGQTPVENTFWIDVYLDPRPAPTHVNQEWFQLSQQGMVWGITETALPIPAGGVKTLRVGDEYYQPGRSQVNWPIAMGTTVYAQVDSVDLDTYYGGVLEDHERVGGTYNNISSVVATQISGGVAIPAGGAARPDPTCQLPAR